MIVLAWILASFSLAITNNAAANAQTYTDSTHQFRVTAPEGWGPAPLEGRIVWHIASKGGSEIPDCGLIVTADKSFSQITSDQYIQSQSEAQLTKVLGLSISNVTIGVWEPAFEFAGQRALHFIYTGVRILVIPITRSGFIRSPDLPHAMS